MAESTHEPRDFHHPYTPYAIQLDFMNALYDAIEDGCVGIFESPTGTGKSLSLICGALTWLRNHKHQDLEAQLEDADNDGADEPEWVREFARKEKKEKLLRSRAELEERLKAIREKETQEKARFEATEKRGFKRMRKDPEVELEEDDDSQFVLDDYESDSESGMKRSGDDSNFSPEVRELMAKLGMIVPGAAPKEEPEMELPDETKIFFCSRTHSQLSQFVNELRKVDIPPSLSTDSVVEKIKHLSLGSRKNLCINPAVTKLSSATAMNERCLDLQKSGTAEGKKCEFLPAKGDQVVVRDFRDHALADIRDIEDLSKLGKKLGTCPYYATRSAIKPSEIVTLPYPLLLQKSSREALGISLKGHIVVIDEAHNLIDAISSIHSITVSLEQLQLCKAQLETYLSKFRNRLKGSNKVYVMQVFRLLDGLSVFLEELSANGKEGEVRTGDLLAAKGIDQINFFKLQKYLAESKLARKLEGYLVNAEEKKTKQLQRRGKRAEPSKPRDTVPVLTHIQGFLMALTNPSAEGRIFFAKTDANVACFKYMLLDPAFHFKDIVEEARAVILAGGTMQPMDDYVNHLLPYLPKEKIRMLSCGHVIPKENLLAWPLVQGPTGKEFEFTFDKRMDPGMIEELGRTIVSACVAIPHGVVCFFPSYSYLDFVISQWQKKPVSGGMSMWDRIGQRKQIFQESSEKSSVEETLTEYGQAIDSGKGALLLSVVGGKMSEGINFNDDLGRAVIMIGLPFPNAHTAEWKAKLQHIETVAYNTVPAGDATKESDVQRKARARAAKQEFFENACMRAVNQSIGRAIRHREDYAIIILVDKRYTSKRIKDKLPGWIQTGLVNIDVSKGGGRFPDFMKGCGAFFRGKM